MAKVDVAMPKMGESITEGTVIVWLKKPGDTVELDEPLLEIGTDKVDTEVPSPAAGILAEILVQEGDTVEVNTVIARLETDVNAAIETAPAAAPPAAAKPAPVVAAARVAAPASAAPAPVVVAAPVASAPTPSAEVATMAAGEPVQVVMPKMGESIMEGTIISWAKKPGDPIELDETLLEIATDKVDTEVPSPTQGVVVQLLFEEGATVEVGTAIAIIASGATAGAAPAPPAAAPAAPQQAAQPAAHGTAQVPAPAAPSGDGAAGPIPRHDEEGSFYTPLVRSISEAEGVALHELKSIHGTGRDGRVTKADLMGYLKTRGAAVPATQAAPAPAAAPAAPRPSAPSQVVATGDGRVEIIKMDRMRQIIADHMT
ncbi:MAG: pyruvate dehydrogenase E2 component (dihydrolipoamide acetyltransferase), partial [Rhodothermales bacterium]